MVSTRSDRALVYTKLTQISQITYWYLETKLRNFQLMKLEIVLNLVQVVGHLCLLILVEYLFFTGNLRIKYLYTPASVLQNLDHLRQRPLIKYYQLVQIQNTIQYHNSDFESLKLKITNYCDRQAIAPKQRKILLDVLSDVYNEYVYNNLSTNDYLGSFLVKHFTDTQTNHWFFKRWVFIEHRTFTNYLFYIPEMLFSLSRPLVKVLVSNTQFVERIVYVAFGLILWISIIRYDWDVTMWILHPRLPALDVSYDSLELCFYDLLKVCIFVSSVLFGGIVKAFLEFSQKAGLLVIKKEKPGSLFLDFYTSVRFKEKTSALLKKVSSGDNKYLKNVASTQDVSLGGYRTINVRSSRQIHSEVYYSRLVVGSVFFASNLFSRVHLSSETLVTQTEQMEHSYLSSVIWRVQGYQTSSVAAAYVFADSIYRILVRLPAFFVKTCLYGDYCDSISFFLSPFNLISAYLLVTQVMMEPKKNFRTTCYKHSILRMVFYYIVVPICFELVHANPTRSNFNYYFATFKVHEQKSSWYFNVYFVEKVFVYIVDYLIYQTLPASKSYHEILYLL